MMEFSEHKHCDICCMQRSREKDFLVSEQAEDGRDTTCVFCMIKRHNIANHKRNLKRREWRAENRDKERLRKKKWRAENRDLVAAAARRYRARVKEKMMKLKEQAKNNETKN